VIPPLGRWFESPLAHLPSFSKTPVTRVRQDLVNFPPSHDIAAHEDSNDTTLTVLSGFPYIHSKHQLDKTTFPSFKLVYFRCSRNHVVASFATSSIFPVSSKRCVAPGTISSFFSADTFTIAFLFKSITTVSLPPTMKRLGA
jgi:hypothetical protein